KVGRTLRQAHFQSPNPGQSKERIPDDVSLKPVGKAETSPFKAEAVHGVPKGNLIKKVETELKTALAPLIAEELLTVRVSDAWIEVEMKEDISFYPATAKLRQRSFPVLEAVTSIFKDIPNAIQIEGFTDNTPIGTDEFPTNWELSSARAASVVRYFNHRESIHHVWRPLVTENISPW
ncbi:MAG: OmpA family protein, partial [Gammaproteobacteria bacterium]|nr:OmpA family protein [Gammaproteobacteria bacterium]